MKKLLIALSITALTVSAYAMSKTPADAGACGADKACIKEAAGCCTTDASCKTKKDAACADKTKACATKAVEEKAGCTGGVCPLTK
jgi:hypothetical protein